MRRPPSGSMVYWRQKGALDWHFGYVTYESGHDLIRMGHIGIMRTRFNSVGKTSSAILIGWMFP